MGFFGKSFEEKVNEAVDAIRAKGLDVKHLVAKVDGKTVTLTGNTSSKEVKTKVMQMFNELVETDNTLNQIKVEESQVAATQASAPAAAPKMTTPAANAPMAGPPTPEMAAAKGDVIHEVVSGDTLSKIAQKYLGKSSLYMQIFEANKDQLTNPDKIKVGQKLRIPGAKGSAGTPVA